MKRKLTAVFAAFALTLSLTACGGEQETTVTGMVVSTEGTVLTLMEMDGGMMGGGERPEGMENFDPESMEGFDPESFEGFEGFDPESFDGTLPEGETFPPRGEGAPGDMPEGMTMPEDGEMPDFGEMGPGFSQFGEDMETKDVDIANAHISVEIDGGKASGTMEDIQAGTFVTVTMNGKGEATNVLVSQQSFMGGWNMDQAD